MMYGIGGDMGWWWLFGMLAMIGIGLLVFLAIRLWGGSVTRGAQPGAEGSSVGPVRSPARQILDERFAKGEMTAEDYKSRLLTLGESD